MSTTIKLRRDTAADWTTKNPKLAEGEIGIETDTDKFKIGNGVSYWADRPYFLDEEGVAVLVTELMSENGGAGPHTHPESDIVNLVTDLAAKAATSALTSHTGNTANPHSVTKAQVGLGSVDNTADSAKPISTATQTALDAKASASGLSTHIADTANPHSVTKTQVGLGNVDNTADAAKPISTATQTALDAKASASGLSTHIADVANPHSVTKTQVGLGSVDNTSDSAKPISTATQTALDAKTPTTRTINVGTGLSGGGDLSVNRTISLDSDLVDISGLSPANNDLIQRKSGAWTNRTPAQFKTDLSLAKGDVGLGSVDNTSDTAKPISTATQTALDAKAPLTSPTFTGTVSAAAVTVSGRLRQDYDVLTDANPVVIDGSLGNRFSVTLTATGHVLGNPSNPVHGQPIFIMIEQDATGGWSMALGANYNDPNSYYTGVATAPGARSYLGVVYHSGDNQFDVLAFAAGY